MFHFRTNVFPTPGAGRPSQRPPQNENPSRSQQQRDQNSEMIFTQFPRAPSSIHYNIVSPRGIAIKVEEPRKERPAQIRERKYQEYKAKKWAKKYGTTAPQVTPSSSFDGVANNNQMTKMSVSFDNSDTVVGYTRHDGGQKHTTTAIDNNFTRARTTDWNNRERTEILSTGSDGLLLKPNASFEERAQVSLARADKLSELYAMNSQSNENDHTALNRNAIFRQNEKTSIMGALSAEAKATERLQQQGAGGDPKSKSKYETATEIRERKKLEYKAKKQAEALGVTLSSSFDGLSMSHDADEEGVETSLPESHSYDYAGTSAARSPENDNTIKIIEYARSDDIFLKYNPSFEEQARLTRARADQLSALYAMTARAKEDDDDDQMNLNRSAIFRQPTPAGSLGGALAGRVAAEKWAQDRHDEARRIQRGGVYVGQVTPTSSFDVLMSELTQSRTRSFDSHEHHPTQNGYLAANGKVYDVPSLC
jgi:hypothetical protein